MKKPFSKERLTRDAGKRKPKTEPREPKEPPRPYKSHARRYGSGMFLHRNFG